MVGELIVDRKKRELIYASCSNRKSGYAIDKGGRVASLRNECSLDCIIKYHRINYHLNNSDLLNFMDYTYMQ
uniref:Uncharacterized protein n=2 Tax=Meloidogyne TaxID=189290 RepID=A0A6V7XNF8_MELEN|nr:unnamed protein product [Meloidogyne enterolobii]CAD2200856.1 unnamed protein product [Meloidogyne enterolobii]